MSVSLFRYSFLFLFFGMSTVMSYAQFNRIVVEKIFSGTSAGNTYRICAEMKNTGDMILAVYGDSLHPLSITATQPFYQNRYGGAISSNVKRSLTEVRDSLKYDSWLTIGSTDNYENNLKTLGLDLKEFERIGASIYTKDGAWYCLPTDKQSVCDDSKRILLMQLTTHGMVSGTISVMGRTADGTNFQIPGISFSTE